MGNLVEDGGLAVRAARPQDFDVIIAVIDDWWGRPGESGHRCGHRDGAAASRPDQNAGLCSIQGWTLMPARVRRVALP